MKEKNCPHCKQTLDVSLFNKNNSKNGYQWICRPCEKIYRKKMRIKNGDKYRETQRKWMRDNPKLMYAKRKRWMDKDPCAKLSNTVRMVVNRSLKENNGIKNDSLLNYLPYTMTQLRDHLESLWTVGMSWETHCSKGWHVDHIIPLNHFYKEHDLTDPAIQHKAFHYTNLQPLWGSENIAKSDKLNSDQKKFSKRN